MNDLERRLKESLTAVRDAYAEEREDDRFEARTRFIERYRRRRRMFTAGSVALAGAALIAGVVFSGGGLDIFAERDPDSEVAGELPEGVVSAVETGSEPVDSGIRTGGIWVANAGDSSITHVDPTINRIVKHIALDGPPQEVDVGEGAVWVAGFGRVTAIDYATDEIIDSAEVGDADDEISISVGEGYVWTVVNESRLVRVDPTTFAVEDVTTTSAPSDVAARDGSVWVLAEEGLLRLDPVSTDLLSTPGGTLRPPGDVSAGRGVVWVASESDNTVVRFRADGTGAPGIFRVTGTYLDMAVSESIVWVLSKPNGNHTLLTALDTNTARQLGEPLRLDGDPVEVSSGSGAVWVVARARGAILRIDPAAVAL